MNDITEINRVRAALHADDRPARCWGCFQMRAPAPGWLVCSYKPYNPAHPSLVYLVCPKCAKSQKAMRGARRAIETKARSIAEAAR